MWPLFLVSKVLKVGEYAGGCNSSFNEFFYEFYFWNEVRIRHGSVIWTLSAPSIKLAYVTSTQK